MLARNSSLKHGAHAHKSPVLTNSRCPPCPHSGYYYHLISAKRVGASSQRWRSSTLDANNVSVTEAEILKRHRILQLFHSSPSTTTSTLLGFKGMLQGGVIFPSPSAVPRAACFTSSALPTRPGERFLVKLTLGDPDGPQTRKQTKKPPLRPSSELST